MMSQSKIMKRLAANPKAMMNFQTRGTLPKMREAYETPLLRLLKRLSPRVRMQITGVKIGPHLGYRCDHQFRNAELLFKWLGGYGQLGEWETLPSESLSINNFGKALTMDDLKKASATFPNISKRDHEYPRI